MTYWDTRAEQVGARVATFDGIDWDAGTAEMAAQILPHLSGVAADLGCGMGRLSAAVRAEGVPVVGLDASAPMLAGREDRGPYVQGDVTALPFADGSLGSAWSVLVAQHLTATQFAAMFAEAARVIVRGGRFVVQWVPGTVNVGPDQRHTAATVKSIADRAGLTWVDAWCAVHPDWAWGAWQA